LFELELAKRDRIIESMEQQLSRAPGLGDKDHVIASQQARIEHLTERCQFELAARSKLLDKLSETLARLEKALFENDRLRNRACAEEVRHGRYESPFRPDQARRLNLDNPVFGTPETPRGRVHIRDSPRFRETPRDRSEDAATPDSTTDLARVDSPGRGEVEESCNGLEGMSVAEMRKSLANLEEERDELGRRISGRVNELERRVEGEKEEKEYHLICKMIARIKAELGNKGSR
jgi:hypothetical protein